MRQHLRSVAFLAAPLLGGLTFASTPVLSELRLAAQAQTPAAPAAAAPARPQGKPEDTEFYEPVPKVVTPGPTVGAPPSDAIVLFDGTNLDQWVASKDKSPAQWPVTNGMFTVDKKLGNIETKRSFKNYQIHLEWRVPEGITGTGQARGNSGLFLAATAPGDGGYELQILDSYENKTYVNGQAGSVYKQGVPLANASRKPGEWQVYDVIWTAPDVQRRRHGQDAGPRDGVPQWRADSEQLRAQRRDGLHRPAGLQAVRHGADPAAVARRSQPAGQLPEHLGAGAAIRTDGR